MTTIATWDEEAGDAEWMPTTCRELGLNEDFLERRLAATPSLLGLESRRGGVWGPFQVFRQQQLPTPQGRIVAPDLVFLSASAHLVIVEVKLADNPELGRSVIAQIIEYAGSFVALDDEQLLAMFPGGRAAGSWASFVRQCFPDENRVDELATTLRERIVSGQIKLVIASDGYPPGFRQLVSGVVTQSALGFDLDVVEVRPHVPSSQKQRPIVLVPATRIDTETIAKTAVTITYRQGETKPSTRIEVTTADPEEIAASVKTAKEWPAIENLIRAL